MKTLFLILCIIVTIIVIIYAYALFRTPKKAKKQYKKIYIDADGAYVIPRNALVEIVYAQISDCIRHTSQASLFVDANMAKKYNSTHTLEARIAVAMMLTIDACWSYLDASEENIKILCDTIVSKFSSQHAIERHLPQLAKILENQEEPGVSYLEIAKYIAHIANPYPDAIGNLLLVTHATEEIKLILECAANLFKTIKIENSGRIVLLKD